VTRTSRERFITAGDLAVRLLEWDGDEPPIMLLHNNRGAADPWQWFVEVSPLTNRFVAPDQRGCGSTSKPPTGYSVWELAADVEATMTELGIERAPIIGCALGASIGLALAAKRSDLVSALVMLDSGFPIDPAIVKRSVATLRGVPQQFESRAEAEDYVRTLPDSLGYSWSRRWREYFEQTFTELPSGQWRFKYDKDAMVEATSHLDDDLWEDAARVECPVLVAVAEASGIVSTDGAARLAEAIPNSQYMVLDGMQHLVFLEDDVSRAERVARDYLVSVGAIKAPDSVL
jgi:pimeloyl-ACP methyl ester carboxylesterase